MIFVLLLIRVSAKSPKFFGQSHILDLLISLLLSMKEHLRDMHCFSIHPGLHICVFRRRHILLIRGIRQNIITHTINICFVCSCKYFGKSIGSYRHKTSEIKIGKESVR